MIRLYKAAAAAVASIALMAGASAASAQSLGFNQAGQNVTASGTLIQFVNYPGVQETTCAVNIYGQVATDGKSITFTSYDGTRVSGGDLACDGSLNFPIVATATNANQINLDQFIVGTRGGFCDTRNYKLAYSGNTATFNGQYFGSLGICKASGDISLTTDSNGAGVNIVTLP
nr:hypothetical protein [uncultured Brevundimonas sp.]